MSTTKRHFHLVLQNKVNLENSYVYITLYRLTRGSRVYGHMTEELNKFDVDRTGHITVTDGPYDDICQEYTKRLKPYGKL